jgi:hypothetical protein
VAAQSIGDWNTTDLTKFVQALTREDETVGNLGRGTDSFTVANKLVVANEFQILQYASTVGAAGAASALPATPYQYLKVTAPDGSVKQFPIYNTA